ncbi:MAG: ABC transporter ATP-binding protein, partial [Acidimicrobiales bacterium]
MLRRLRGRAEWKFLTILPRADRRLAVAWWVVLVVRGALPAGFAVAMGVLIAAVQAGRDLLGPLVLMGATFVMLQVLAPLHQVISANLGSRVSAWLYDRLTEACIRPPGLGHLEDPELTSDLTVAREFDFGMTGPPMFMNVDFIAGGLVEAVGGLSSALVLSAYAWWAPLLLGGAWMATHWLLRESSVWRDRNTDDVRQAQRHAEYAYKLAVDPPAAKELRLFGLAGWTIDRFIARRRQLFDLQHRATRLREKPVIWCLLLIAGANVVVFWSLAAAVSGGRLGLGPVIVFAQAAVGTSMIAFGGLNWAMDGAAAPVAAVLRLEAAMGPKGALATPPQAPSPAAGTPSRDVRFRDVGFAYPQGGQTVLDGFDLTIPAGSSIAIVGQNGAGKTTLAKLLCRLYDPTSGVIEVDGVDLRSMDVDDWRSRVTAVFQDFIRFERSLRENVAPDGAPDELIVAALAEAGASG